MGRTSEAVRELRLRQLAAGLCTYGSCASKPTAGYRRCEVHREYFNAYYRKYADARKVAGVCVTCGSTTEAGNIVCLDCRRGQSTRYAKRLSKGNCRDCGEARLPDNSISCEHHYFTRLAAGHSKRGLAKLRATDLRLLFEASPVCAYTGVPLRLCDRDIWNAASLDHKIPVSKGGTNDISNLQFVAWPINQLKSSLSHEEFVTRYGHLFDHFFPEQLIGAKRA